MWCQEDNYQINVFFNHLCTVKPLYKRPSVRRNPPLIEDVNSPD